MKRRIFFGFISIIGCLFSITIVDVYANGVPTPGPRRGPYVTIILMFIMFIIAVGIEYLVFTYRRLDLAPRDISVLYTFLKINLITFPLTQILAYIVYIYALQYYWIYVLGIEILVVLVEWRLILFEFKKKNARILNSTTTLIIVIIANSISFFLGFIPYLLISFYSFFFFL